MLNLYYDLQVVKIRVYVYVTSQVSSNDRMYSHTYAHIHLCTNVNVDTNYGDEMVSLDEG